jgi:hypothetical protein
MDTAAATYSNTTILPFNAHFHFVNFLFLTPSMKRHHHHLSSSILYIQNLCVSLSLILPLHAISNYCAPSGGRQLKYLKLKAPKKKEKEGY